MPKTVVGVLRLADGERGRGGGASSYDAIEIDPVGGGPPLRWDGFGIATDLRGELSVGLSHTFYYSKTWRTIYAVRVEGRPGRFSCFAAKPLAMLMYLALVFGSVPAGVIVAFFLGLGGVLVGIAMFLCGFLQIFLSLDAMIARGKFNRDERRWRKRLPSQPAVP